MQRKCNGDSVEVTLPLLLDATTDLFGESLSKQKAFLMKAVILTPGRISGQPSSLASICTSNLKLIHDNDVIRYDLT